jgi:hypothetical protein
MEQEWITDRLPTEADGDENGDVRLRRWPGSSEYNYAHWSHIGPGAPWLHTSYWRPTAEPTPTASRRVVQIAASTSLDLFALCDDGTIWINVSRSDWAELPAIPQP